MSRPRPITDEELKAIQQSVAEARQRLIYKKGFMGKPGQVFTVDRTVLLKAYKWFLGRMGLPLNHPPVKALLLEAIEANDQKFLGRLGKVLSRKPILFQESRMMTRLEDFLLDHWAESKDGLPQLFYLTPLALTRVCRERLDSKRLSQDAVTKTRFRLRLKPFRRQKQDACWRGGKLTFPPVDKG